MKSGMKIISLLLVLNYFYSSRGEPVLNVLTHCCDLGKSRAETNQPCDAPSNLFARIARNQQAVCKTTAAICCLARYRRLMCDNGIEAARQSQLCISITGTTGGEFFKDCCEACKLGIAVRNSNDISSCNFNTEFSFDYPWEDAYGECCLRANHTARIVSPPPQNVTVTTASSLNTTSAHATYQKPTTKSSNNLPRDAAERKLWMANATAAPLSSPSLATNSINVHCNQPNICDHLCVDTPTGHLCQCYTGYSLQSDARTCVSTSPRCLHNSPCDQLCTDTGDAIICNCKLGYELQHDRRTCADIDECALDDDDCDLATQNCVNIPGSYDCVRRTARGIDEEEPALESDTFDIPHNCDIGFQYNPTTYECEDIDECILGFDNCDRRTHFCTNQVGSFTCNPRQSASQCPPGYEFNQTTSSCVDVNECERGLDACERNKEFCFNFQGTYECQRKTQSTCPAGYKYSKSGKSCEDVDECGEDIHNCDREKEVCRNTDGGYECDGKCDSGFRHSPTSGICTDIDECAENTHKCVKGGVCVNTVGSYECTYKTKITCPAGYKQSEVDGQCEDVDECVEKMHSCDEKTEDCVNEVGQYQCVEKAPAIKKCESGFKPDPTNPHNCIDVNECTENSHNCANRSEQCFNTIGSFECHSMAPKEPDCPSGHSLNASTNQCLDINECDLKTDTCSRTTEICVNTNGSYWCWLMDCPTGHRPNITIKACEDIDECVENAHNCTAREKCVNARGSFSCVAAAIECSKGYRYNSQTLNCEDIDECQQKLHTCNLSTSDCRNTPGGFVCLKRPQCPSGYRYVNGASRRCVDVDECAESVHNCHRDNEICVNTRGSYRCLPYNFRSQQPNTTTTSSNTVTTPRPATTTQAITTPAPTRQTQYCPSGYRFSHEQRMCVDINECQQSSHSCLASQRCDNTIGSFTCIRLTGCGTGYTLNAHSNQCEDDDECELGNHNCGHMYQCRNTHGSFRCDRKSCPYGHRLGLDGNCQLSTCETGMKPDANGNCIDINECESPNVCRSYERCINTAGSYKCQSLVNCGPGYELDSQGASCIDVDECTRGKHECRGGQQCINRPGGYLCQCPAGYLLNYNRECEDIDECSRYGKVCAHNSECQNTPGSYQCHCKEGFQHGDNDRTCNDIDECQLYPNICHHKCVNTWGSHQCVCNPGFTLGDDKRSCIDVDECSLYKGPGSLCIGTCVNEPGSFSCSCPQGYTLGADKRTCQDVDECKEPGTCTGENEVCLNTRGGYKCNQIQCPPEYVRDSTHKKSHQFGGFVGSVSIRPNIEEGRAAYVCHRWCDDRDLVCQRNITATITYQFLKLPAVSRFIRRPFVISQFISLIRATMVNGVRVHFEFNHRNSIDSYFDLRQDNNSAKLFLVRPIYGELYGELHFKMDVIYYNSVVITHQFVVTVINEGQL